ncbi:hypothetical protein ACLBKU_09775 [Erythrobacter sp. NE805]|uniref:hypothetical protein n=1 Tax=Erythrobacter sp. NE805 TaxID=3389875 RepID=UPI00396B11D1
MIGLIPLLAAVAAQPEHSVREIGTFAIESLPLVIGFDEALQAHDEVAMRALAADDLQIEPLFGRLLDENKSLKFKDLYDFVSRCTQTGRMSANHVSVTVHYDCPKEMRGNMVFNFDDGKISRVAIGELPTADVVKIYPKDRKN